jgi:large subunit ribosomal protein L21
MRAASKKMQGMTEEPMFAIIQTGGKQYRVSEGDVIRVEKLALDKGAAIEFDSLLVGGEGVNVTTKAKIAGQVLSHVKGEKIYIDKYKSGIQYRRRNGHRQQYTNVKITGIK